MSDDLHALEDWAGALLARLSTSERRKLNQDIARELRTSHRKRIAAQKNPDGSKFAPRKQVKEERAKPVRFLYRKPGGSERIADMRSWGYQGKLMVGFDREAGDLRSFNKDRVVRFLKPGGGGGGGALRDKRGRIKRQAMFKKIGSARHLKIQSDPNTIAIGFIGRTARLARIHQFGLKDKAGERAREVEYERRQLLGLTGDDLELIRDRLLEHMAGWRD